MSRTRWLSFTSYEDLLAQARLEDNGEAGVAVEGVYTGFGSGGGS